MTPAPTGYGGAAAGRYQPGWYSVDLPNTGTQIKVVGVNGGAMTVRVAAGRLIKVDANDEYD